MRVALSGGPRDNTFVDLPAGQGQFRFPIPKPTTLSTDPMLDANYEVALYEFSGYGVVGLTGHVYALIFNYKGKE